MALSCPNAHSYRRFQSYKLSTDAGAAVAGNGYAQAGQAMSLDWHSAFGIRAFG